ncbi:hypothetical protein ACTXP8_26655, partial [Klebsiella pneumoniae]|uniref:hypothetical protein n=1 Tax=Klebsiella pneumoniae TaxID=573 RepID=UPI003FD56907
QRQCRPPLVKIPWDEYKCRLVRGKEEEKSEKRKRHDAATRVICQIHKATVSDFRSFAIPMPIANRKTKVTKVRMTDPI